MGIFNISCTAATNSAMVDASVLLRENLPWEGGGGGGAEDHECPNVMDRRFIEGATDYQYSREQRGESQGTGEVALGMRCQRAQWESGCVHLHGALTRCCLPGTPGVAE